MTKKFKELKKKNKKKSCFLKLTYPLGKLVVLVLTMRASNKITNAIDANLQFTMVTVKPL